MMARPERHGHVSPEHTHAAAGNTVTVDPAKPPKQLDIQRGRRLRIRQKIPGHSEAGKSRIVVSEGENESERC